MTNLSSIAEIAQSIRQNKTTPVEIVEGYLKLIEKIESEIEAWVTIDHIGTIENAKELTRELETGKLRGPLHGIPVGIKDIYNTRGLRTTMGSKSFIDNVPNFDAEVVSILRQAGAIILGKTETTEFAYLDPAPTRNPWNLEHTPGGSSSGSAAAVASNMCPLAFGTQTGGSITRPASYCGVIGVKPTYDLISRRGIYPLSWSLDHVGFMTKTVEDTALTFRALTGNKFELKEKDCPQIGYIDGYFKDNASTDVRDNFLKSLDRLEKAGANVKRIEPPRGMEVIHSAHRVILASEAASVHRRRFSEDPYIYRQNIRGLISSGLVMEASVYLDAQRIRRIFIENLQLQMANFDVVATPSAPSSAPLDLQSTGSSSFNVPWSITGFPTITIPSGLSLEKLPLGFQLAAKPYQEELLFDTGLLCERILESIGSPPLQNILI